MPINESAVYYSSHLFDNHAATNPGWSLGHSLVETRSTQNRFVFMETAEAQRRVSELLQRDSGDVARRFITPQRTADSSLYYPPLNVVFLLLESHTAQVIEELGGEKGVCPNLGRLAREGILFERCYGSGYRTDQGLVSILSGYPAQPDQSIILLDDKAAKLPSIPKVLKDNGYNTAFIYGGELTFANIGLWLANQRFDKIISQRDFSEEEKTQRWGVDDRLLLERMIQEINGLQAPFFAAALTLSVHPPYDAPYKSRWSGNSDREKFLNSAAFTDEALGEFFRLAQQQPWFGQTLFLLVADHGASQPGGLGMDNPASRHTPLIIYGEPLQAGWRNQRIGVYGNHHDIPALLFNILQEQKFTVAPQDFFWSRNLFAVNVPENTRQTAAGEKSSRGFAYYTNENGLGWATAHGKGFYEFGSREWRIFEGRLDSADRADAQAYLQCLYDDFLMK
jgi:phosphoglycerol transferase MdoB-like AlkP superfamily enzyme